MIVLTNTSLLPRVARPACLGSHETGYISTVHHYSQLNLFMMLPFSQYTLDIS
jgi:hypothetical protein